MEPRLKEKEWLGDSERVDSNVLEYIIYKIYIQIKSYIWYESQGLVLNTDEYSVFSKELLIANAVISGDHEL